MIQFDNRKAAADATLNVRYATDEGRNARNAGTFVRTGTAWRDVTIGTITTSKRSCASRATKSANPAWRQQTRTVYAASTSESTNASILRHRSTTTSLQHIRTRPMTTTLRRPMIPMRRRWRKLSFHLCYYLVTSILIILLIILQS